MAYDLRDDERCAQPEAGAFGEAPAARPRHEDEGLADDAHLQVQGRHHLLGAAAQRSHVESVLHCHTHTGEILCPAVSILFSFHA